MTTVLTTGTGAGTADARLATGVDVVVFTSSKSFVLFKAEGVNVVPFKTDGTDVVAFNVDGVMVKSGTGTGVFDTLDVAAIGEYVSLIAISGATGAVSFDDDSAADS